MKSMFKALALGLVVALSACSKDDDDKNNNNNNNTEKLGDVIEGKWEVTKLLQKNGKNVVGNQTINTFSGTGRDFDGTFEFKADGTTQMDFGYVMDQTSTVPGFPAQTDSVVISKTQFAGAYQVLTDTKISTNSLTGTTEEFNVSGITSNTMTWKGSVSIVDTLLGFTSSMDMEIDFVKQ